MNQFLPILKKSLLFDSIREQDIASMLPCLKTTEHRFRKGEYVLQQGDRVDAVSVVVHGALRIQKEDYWGNRDILRHVGVGELFGEAYIAPDSGVLLNDVIAAEDCTVLSFDVRRLLTTCSSACLFHTQVVQNLVFAMSEKNRLLVQKLGYMSCRTTRGKLIAYLSEEAKRQNRACFAIPFNRQQLADFLSVDRSAMSAELCRMRDEGLLRFEKNRFELLGGHAHAYHGL